MLAALLPMLGLFAVVNAQASVIDRVAVVIENHVITESAIVQEIRLEAFQNGSTVDLSPANKRKIAERLLEQYLVRREMENNRYPIPDLASAAKDLATLKKVRFQDNSAAYREALAKYSINEQELLTHLNSQDTMMDFIDFRFRPAVQISDAELQDYYESTFVPQWKETHKDAAPSLESQREGLEQILTQSHIDQSLDRWIGETRTQLRIRFHDEVFK